MKTLKALKAELLANPEIRREYDQIAVEYEIVRRRLERIQLLLEQRLIR